MIVVGLDLETTGLDITNDRPIEIGLVVWTTKWNRVLDSRTLLIQSDGVPVLPEITEITGLIQPMVDRFGYTPEEAYDEVEFFVDKAEALVAFNGGRLDIPMLQALAKRLGKQFPNKFLIDPFVDTPATSAAASPGMRPQELITMCAKEGIHYDAHEAGADVVAMLKLMSKRPFEFVLARAQSPIVVVQSLQGRYENDKAKKHKFRWNPDRKIWWKAVKEIDLPHLSEATKNDFGMRATDLRPEELETT